MRNGETKYWVIVASKDHVKNGIAHRELHKLVTENLLR